jgi:hypothetical protein
LIAHTPPALSSAIADGTDSPPPITPLADEIRLPLGPTSTTALSSGAVNHTSPLAPNIHAKVSDSPCGSVEPALVKLTAVPGVTTYTPPAFAVGG